MTTFLRSIIFICLMGLLLGCTVNPAVPVYPEQLNVRTKSFATAPGDPDFIGSEAGDALQTDFQTKDSPEVVLAFYQQALADTGWSDSIFLDAETLQASSYHGCDDMYEIIVHVRPAADATAVTVVHKSLWCY